MNTEERTVICPYCKTKFRTTQYNKVYCSYSHATKHRNIIKMKELIKLNEYDLELWKEYNG